MRDERGNAADNVQQAVSEMPAAEILKRAQFALQSLQERDPNLAKELGEMLHSGAHNPEDVKRAIKGFIGAHPEALEAFA